MVRRWIEPEEAKEARLPFIPYTICNIENNSPENLLDFVNILQRN